MKPGKKVLIIVAIFVAVTVAAFFFNYPSVKGPVADREVGKALAIKYCQSCHLLPDPALLDKASWKKLLPEMGVRLGIQTAGLVIPAEDKALYPVSPALDNSEWQSILDYYDAASPAHLPAQKKTLVVGVADGNFNALLPPESMFRSNPLVSCIRMDNSVQPGRLFVYDAGSKYLYLFGRSGLKDSIYCEDVIVDIEVFQGRIYACSIGSSLQIGTSRNRFGKVFPVTVNKVGKMSMGRAIISGLARPVQAIPADINGDGRPDFVVAEFGGINGSLSWFENKGGEGYVQHVIRNLPGSVTVYVDRIRTKASPDLWVLFAQGDEGVFHFINDGKGEFTGTALLRFPSSYGSTSFVFADMNGDGFRDIVYTCGDNGDVTAVLKPYHGIYIYINDGQDHFSRSFFYPMHGCYKVVAGDFSGGGRQDLVAIAYFTDAANAEWFVHLRNEGGLKFTALSAPKEVNFDSALTMDAGDFDGDGLSDLLIGNALDGKNVRGAPFAILRNAR